MKKSLLMISMALSLVACQPNNGFKKGEDTQAADQKAKLIASIRTPDQEYLDQNRQQEGVKITPSGLQYRINKEGTGKTPKLTDVVTVAYTGRLIDGTVFDSTDNHGGAPISFAVNRVILGWQEGLQLMKEGADYTFFIPYQMAYGEQGIPGTIPSKATLIFDVRLVKVN